MSRPKRIKCGLFTYPVRWHSDAIKNDDGYPILAGQAIHAPAKQRCIRVSEASDDVAETLMHELLHCIFTDRDLGRMTVSDDAEEHMVASLSRGLVAALRENKGLADYFVSGS